jgi:hypothetical protein
MPRFTGYTGCVSGRFIARCFVLHNQNKQIGGLISGSLSPSYNTFSRKRPEGGAVNLAGVSE